MRVLISCIVALMLHSVAAAAEDLLLLRLTYVVDDVVTDEVAVVGNAQDPNRRSVDDQFAIVLDQTSTDAMADLAADLAIARRIFSYDSLSGGIDAGERLALCRMAGPATGWILETRYLTYDGNAIVGSEMRPVLSAAGNCLFRPTIRPVDDNAALAAAQVLGRLRSLMELPR